MHNSFLFIISLLIFFGGHSQSTKPKSNSISHLKFLSEYDLPHKMQFRETTVGGLSGIDYDAKDNVYYFISDDRSAINPARFYTAKIRVEKNKIDTVEFTGVKSLRQKNGEPYPSSKQDPFHAPDPEALRYDPVNNEIVWSSEGERNVGSEKNVLEDPSVTVVDRNGNYKDSFELPANMHMRAIEKGPRQNGVFEGMSFTSDHKYLFVSVEEPLYEDGPRAGIKDSSALIRIIKFDVNKKSQVAQYVYKVDPVAYPSLVNSYKINGVSDILCVGNNKLIVVERSFSTGRPGCTIKVFLADLNGAKNAAGINSLHINKKIKPLPKKLLLNMDELDMYIDNVEGVSPGPVLPNGHRSLLFIVDDNFSPLEKIQLLLFEVIP